MLTKFCGTWKLIHCKAIYSDGTVTLPYGDEPKGRLVYDPAGNMTVQFMKQGRPKFALNSATKGAPHEIKEAFEGMVAYFGTYELNENERTITHHVEGSYFPNWESTDQVRFYQLESDRLTLNTLPTKRGERTVIVSLVWERMSEVDNALDSDSR